MDAIERKLLNSKGERISGEVIFPENKITGSVLFVHGFFSDMDERGGFFRSLANELIEKNIAVRRFDFSGCGKSEGKQEDRTSSLWIEELKLWTGDKEKTGKLKGLDEIIVAASFGCSLVGIVRPKARGYVFICGGGTPEKNLKELFGKNLNIAGISERISTKGICRVGHEFWKDLRKYDFLEESGEIEVPVLFIAGENDEFISMQDSEDLFLRIGSGKEIVKVKNGDHMFTNENARQEVFVRIIKKVKEWSKTE